MPIVRADARLILYARVPRCGGEAMTWYLRNRFGAVAFHDNSHTRQPKRQRWSMTSPQHIDAGSLACLFPEGFFDTAFATVRHPVSRLVSAYRFQREVEFGLSRRTTFSDWLDLTVETMANEPFLYDNHARPMAQIVPEGAAVFHVEHGLDSVITWLDDLTGRRAGPRAIPRINGSAQPGPPAPGTPTPGPVVPSSQDLDLIADFYAEDFRRFGYRIDAAMPLLPAPDLSEAFRAERDAERRQMRGPARPLHGLVNLLRQNLFPRR